MSSVVLVATDFSAASEHAVTVAVENARRGGAELHIVHVLLPDEGPQGLDEAQRRIHALQHAAATRLGPPATPPKTHVKVGAHAASIVQLARAIDADLVVVGTHSHAGARRAVLGSVAEAVVRSAPCTVVVARPKERHAP